MSGTKVRKKDIVIISDSIPLFREEFRKLGIQVFSTHKEIGFIQRFFRKFYLLFGWFPKIWYGNWKRVIASKKVVICFATDRIDHVEYIERMYPNIRIILWYWNPVKACYHPSLIKSERIEKWSFDRDDCEKLDLKYNSQFYFRTISENFSRIEKDEYKISFVGNDKGRKTIIESIKKFCKLKNFSEYIKVVENRKDSITYEEYLAIVAQSQSVLDIYQVGQTGMTLRAMESLFFNKQLITNNQSIASDLMYPKSNMITINNSFTEDDQLTLAKFLEKAPIENNISFLDYYDATSWLSRFFE